MEYTEFAELRARLSERLKPGRYEHTLGVAYTAAALAMAYGEDPLQAELAGLLHDCAKCYSETELIALCAEAGLPLTEDELNAPAVIHAKYGAYLAEHDYGVTDQAVLSAIASHTMGKPDMTPLEKFVFTADYIEPLRNQAEHLTKLRRLAFSDLDACVFRILRDTADYLARSGRPVASGTAAALAFYEAKAADHPQEETF